MKILPFGRDREMSDDSTQLIVTPTQALLGERDLITKQMSCPSFSFEMSHLGLALLHVHANVKQT